MAFESREIYYGTRDGIGCVMKLGCENVTLVIARALFIIILITKLFKVQFEKSVNVVSLLYYLYNSERNLMNTLFRAGERLFVSS